MSRRKPFQMTKFNLALANLWLEVAFMFIDWANRAIARARDWAMIEERELNPIIWVSAEEARSFRGSGHASVSRVHNCPKCGSIPADALGMYGHDVGKHLDLQSEGGNDDSIRAD